MFSLSLQSGRRWFNGSTAIGRSECRKWARAWSIRFIIASWLGCNASDDFTKTVSVTLKESECEWKGECGREREKERWGGRGNICTNIGVAYKWMDAFKLRTNRTRRRKNNEKSWPLLATCNELKNSFPDAIYSHASAHSKQIHNPLETGANCFVLFFFFARSLSLSLSDFSFIRITAFSHVLLLAV